LGALQTMMEGLQKHCAQYPTAIAEDCGQRDGTADFLQKGRKPSPRKDLLATEYVVPDAPMGVNYPNVRVFMGDRNLGVTGNTNRIIRWFMDETDADHLCLCNDDLFVDGDFVKAYASAHNDLSVGLFCFCDFDKASPAISGNPESYKWTTYPWRGYKVKLLPRFTGIMLSITRSLLKKVGYFDAAFGKFGEEHSDFTIRCRLAGGIKLEGQDMNCLDVEHKLLRHQDVETSVQGTVRKCADEEAATIMRRCTDGYKYRHYYRPYLLLRPKFANGYTGGGISVDDLLESDCKLVTDLV
jgi:glycosyltransferase involved in cell wall biosynthesis